MIGVKYSQTFFKRKWSSTLLMINSYKKKPNWSPLIKSLLSNTIFSIPHSSNPLDNSLHEL